MSRVWVNCNTVPSGLLRGEMLYRVRRHDGTVLEGYAQRSNIQPTWKYSIQRKSKKKGLSEITAVWGWIQAEIIQKGPDKTLVAFPDDNVALVSNLRIKETAPEVGLYT